MKKTIPWILALLLCFSGCQNTALMPSHPTTTAATETTTPPTEETKPIQSIPIETIAPESTAPTETTPPETVPPETQHITTEPPATEPHIHEYLLTDGNDPTCMEDGTKVYACTCGESYTDTIMFLGHIWDSWVVSREPTDTQEGEGYYLCARCGAREASAIPKLEKKLTNDDWQEVARLTLQYINEIRNSQGACTAIEMPGCTLYAKARSEQMAAKEKVEHNYRDGIEAATRLQYGRYIDPALYGMEGEPYYQVYGGEAVGNGYGKTAEEVARCLAEGVSNSPQHWNYVGADKNGYMSIGVTLNNGWWYCCIITSPVNLDKNPLGY